MGNLIRKSSLEQLKRLRKLTKGFDIGDRADYYGGDNLISSGNPIDKHIDSYDDFKPRNNDFKLAKFENFVNEAFKGDIKNNLYVVDKNGKIIAFNLTYEETQKVPGFYYDETGSPIEGRSWGAQVIDNTKVNFKNLEEIQVWYDERDNKYLMKKTFRKEYSELSKIAKELYASKIVDHSIINRGSCFKFAKMISDALGYNNFTYVFSDEEQAEIHVYIKLSKNLYFDANGFSTLKEVNEDYINDEDCYLSDSNDKEELNSLADIDTSQALSTIELSNVEIKEVKRIISAATKKKY